MKTSLQYLLLGLVFASFTGCSSLSAPRWDWWRSAKKETPATSSAYASSTYPGANALPSTAAAADYANGGPAAVNSAYPNTGAYPGATSYPSNTAGSYPGNYAGTGYPPAGAAGGANYNTASAANSPSYPAAAGATNYPSVGPAYPTTGAGSYPATGAAYPANGAGAYPTTQPQAGYPTTSAAGAPYSATPASFNGTPGGNVAPAGATNYPAYNPSTSGASPTGATNTSTAMPAASGAGNSLVGDRYSSAGGTAASTATGNYMGQNSPVGQTNYTPPATNTNVPYYTPGSTTQYIGGGAIPTTSGQPATTYQR